MEEHFATQLRRALSEACANLITAQGCLLDMRAPESTFVYIEKALREIHRLQDQINRLVQLNAARR